MGGKYSWFLVLLFSFVPTIAFPSQMLIWALFPSPICILSHVITLSLLFPSTTQALSSFAPSVPFADSPPPPFLKFLSSISPYNLSLPLPSDVFNPCRVVSFIWHREPYCKTEEVCVTCSDPADFWLSHLKCHLHELHCPRRVPVPRITEYVGTASRHCILREGKETAIPTFN